MWVSHCYEVRISPPRTGKARSPSEISKVKFEMGSTVSLRQSVFAKNAALSLRANVICINPYHPIRWHPK
ncbi:hypothetical protein NPIL_614161 [Nephila pilipes]|uniref:Uncharacterized protein n=1 Tax=Nephila pilipes TaxID=299642 RepID=A0A8X6PGE2_NEPPI|nr:hypothetical protein NPIL_614161 [Nephila pilipes]